jgi:integrase
VDLPQGSVPRDHWLLEEECDILLRACLPGEDGTWQEAMAKIDPKTDRLPRAFGFVAIALETAARFQAVLKLTRFQVDLKNGMINFAPAGHRQTKKRRPVVPISDRLRPALERFLKQNESASYVLGTPGSIRFAFETALRRAEKVLAAAGRPERAKAMRRTTPHTLRHTWATLAAQNRVPLWEIAGVLGDTISTVTKNYAHHNPDFLRDAVNFRSPKAPAKETDCGPRD